MYKIRRADAFECSCWCQRLRITSFSPGSLRTERNDQSDCMG